VGDAGDLERRELAVTGDRLRSVTPLVDGRLFRPHRLERLDELIARPVDDSAS
jgi:hypothetical protein